MRPIRGIATDDSGTTLMNFQPALGTGEGETTESLSGSVDLLGLRVAIVNDSIVERNGVSTYYSDLVDRLRMAGAEVRMFCPKLDPANDWIDMSFPGDPTQQGSIPNVRQMWPRLKAFAPQVVVLPSPGPWGLTGFLLARRSGAPVICGYHASLDNMLDNYRPTTSLRILAGLANALTRAVMKRSACVVIPAGVMVEEARALGARKVRVVGTPLAARFFESEPRGPGPEVERITFLGRLAPEKNIEAVLEAAKALPHRQFIFAGDGPLRDLVVQAADELSNVDYRGWTARSEVISILDEADLLVLPSHAETMGTVVLEAMARRTSVLVSAHCGIVDWPELSPSIFQIGEAESLADAIERVADTDPADRIAMADQGAAAAAEMDREAIGTWASILSEAAGVGPAAGHDEEARVVNGWKA